MAAQLRPERAAPFTALSCVLLACLLSPGAGPATDVQTVLLHTTVQQAPMPRRLTLQRVHAPLPRCGRRRRRKDVRGGVGGARQRPHPAVGVDGQVR